MAGIANHAGRLTNGWSPPTYQAIAEEPKETQNPEHQAHQNRYVIQLSTPSLSTKNWRKGSESLSATMSRVTLIVARSNTKNVIKAVMLFMVSRAGVVAGAEGGVYLSPVCIMTVYGCLTPQVALSAVNLYLQ